MHEHTYNYIRLQKYDNVGVTFEGSRASEGSSSAAPPDTASRRVSTMRGGKDMYDIDGMHTYNNSLSIVAR